MRRLLVLLLAVLLLAGCVTQPPGPTGQTDPTSSEATKETRAPGEHLYLPGDRIEEQTDAAVRAYRLDSSEYCNGAVLLGEQMLLFYETEIRAYVDELLFLEHTVQVETALVPETHMVQVTESGVGYYLEDSRTAVVLDAALVERFRTVLPEDIQGFPIFGNGLDELYYCTEDGVRVLEQETGIARLLRQQTNIWQELTQTGFDGQLLACVVTDQDDLESTTYIMTETGVQIDADGYVHNLYTYGDSYFLIRWIGAQPEYLFGQRDGAEQVFSPASLSAQLVPALPLGGVITAGETEDGTELSFYDLASGCRTASVLLPEFTALRSIVADQRGYVWFLAADPQTGRDMLYRWEIGESPVWEDTVYTSLRYTADAPDTEGLAECTQQAQDIGDKYGLRLRIWESAVTEPWTDMEPDYRVDVFRENLNTLDQVLSAFPEGFLRQLGSLCDSGAVTISLVRDTGAEVAVQQVWVDGDTHIALEMGNGLESQLYFWLYRVIDTYVMNSNSMLDEWDADAPVDDRTQLFVAAMTAEDGAYFQSDEPQQKLEQLCEAIRDAFGLEQLEEALPWEQYLEEPLY